MALFEEVVEANRKMFAEGKEPGAHAILVKDDKPVAVIGLVFVDDFTKHLTFSFALPQIIRTEAPETCIFVLPSRMKKFNPEGDVVEEEDVVVIHEVDAIQIRTAIIRRKDGEAEVIEPEEKKTLINVLEPIRQAMKSVWADVI